MSCSLTFSYYFTSLSEFTHLHKEVDNSQRNDDDDGESSGKTEEKQCPKYIQQKNDPGAKYLWNDFIYR